jgi:rod shape-determining protein MreC
MVLAGLVITSILMLTAHFTEARSGPLHVFQRGVATLLSPLETVANAALKPARDTIDWFDETWEARGDNERLEAELAEARDRLAEAEVALGENEELRGLLALDGDELAGFDPPYQPVSARIVTRSSSLVNARVGIDAGSGDGVEVNDPVVAADGLVGRVDEVTPSGAQVELITDHRNGVSVIVAPDGPQGIISAEVGNPDDLRLEFFSNDSEVEEGQFLVTAGWSNGTLSSAYPRGIPVGEVAETPLASEDLQEVSVLPFVEMRDLTVVQVLTGGPARPGVDP